MTFTHWILQSWAEFLKGNPFATFISAALGAFGGAWATSRRETKRAIVAELNSVNAARMLSFAICNTFLSMKKQHIRNLKAEYDAERSAFLRAQVSARHGAAQGHPVTIEFRANFRTLSPPRLPLATLERQIFDKTPITGRGLAAASQLVSVVDALEKAIEYRNSIAREAFESRMPPGQKAMMYFGLKDASGVSDERIKTNIDGLSNYTDDCIWFSKLLAADLLTYGKALRRRFVLRFRRLPKLAADDWTRAESEGLVPPDSQYIDWLKGFKKQPSRGRPLFESLKRRLFGEGAHGARS
jgi:hypothetical protein